MDIGAWASVVILLLLVALWELATEAGFVDPAIVSRPSDVIAAGRLALTSRSIYIDAAITFASISIGLLAGLGVGVALGVAMGTMPRVRWTLEWWFLVMNSLPRFALAPILIIAFGLGLLSKATVAFLGSVIPITLLVMTGVRQIPMEIHRVAMSFRLSRTQVLTKVVMPGATPHLLTGLQLGFSRALASVVVAEMYNPLNGLGRWIAIGQTSLDTSQLVFASILVAVIGAAFVHAFTLAERRLIRWRA